MDDRTYIITEFCPHCENEIEMRWDTDARGFQAVCPVCGERLMLCDECRHCEDCYSVCDYDNETGLCHRSQRTAPESALRIETPLGALVVEPATDPDHPGLYINLRRSDVDFDMPLALIEFSADDAEDSSHIATYVWGDAQQEDCANRIIHQGVEEFFKLEDVQSHGAEVSPT